MDSKILLPKRIRLSLQSRVVLRFRKAFIIVLAIKVTLRICIDQRRRTRKSSVEATVFYEEQMIVGYTEDSTTYLVKVKPCTGFLPFSCCEDLPNYSSAARFEPSHAWRCLVTYPLAPSEDQSIMVLQVKEQC